MTRRAQFVLAFLLGLCFVLPARAQVAEPDGTPHGVFLTWQAAPQDGDLNAYVGYYVFRCVGTCVDNPAGWTQKTAAPLNALAYQDPQTDGFSAGSIYTYTVQTVDSAQHTSTFGTPTATAIIPTAGFPLNPDIPSAVTAQAHTPFKRCATLCIIVSWTNQPASASNSAPVTSLVYEGIDPGQESPTPIASIPVTGSLGQYVFLGGYHRQTFYFVIQNQDASGNLSAVSAEVQATWKGRPK